MAEVDLLIDLLKSEKCRNLKVVHIEGGIPEGASKLLMFMCNSVGSMNFTKITALGYQKFDRQHLPADVRGKPSSTFKDVADSIAAKHAKAHKADEPLVKVNKTIIAFHEGDHLNIIHSPKWDTPIPLTPVSPACFYYSGPQSKDVEFKFVTMKSQNIVYNIWRSLVGSSDVDWELGNNRFLSDHPVEFLIPRFSTKNKVDAILSFMEYILLNHTASGLDLLLADVQSLLHTIAVEQLSLDLIQAIPRWLDLVNTHNRWIALIFLSLFSSCYPLSTWRNMNPTLLSRMCCFLADTASDPLVEIQGILHTYVRDLIEKLLNYPSPDCYFWIPLVALPQFELTAKSKHTIESKSATVDASVFFAQLHQKVSIEKVSHDPVCSEAVLLVSVLISPRAIQSLQWISQLINDLALKPSSLSPSTVQEIRKKLHHILLSFSKQAEVYQFLSFMKDNARILKPWYEQELTSQFLQLLKNDKVKAIDMENLPEMIQFLKPSDVPTAFEMILTRPELGNWFDVAKLFLKFSDPTKQFNTWLDNHILLSQSQCTSKKTAGILQFFQYCGNLVKAFEKWEPLMNFLSVAIEKAFGQFPDNTLLDIVKEVPVDANVVVLERLSEAVCRVFVKRSTSMKAILDSIKILCNQSSSALVMKMLFSSLSSIPRLEALNIESNEADPLIAILEAPDDFWVHVLLLSRASSVLAELPCLVKTRNCIDSFQKSFFSSSLSIARLKKLIPYLVPLSKHVDVVCQTQTFFKEISSLRQKIDETEKHITLLLDTCALFSRCDHISDFLEFRSAIQQQQDQIDKGTIDQFQSSTFDFGGDLLAISRSIEHLLRSTSLANFFDSMKVNESVTMKLFLERFPSYLEHFNTLVVQLWDSANLTMDEFHRLFPTSLKTIDDKEMNEELQLLKQHLFRIKKYASGNPHSILMIAQHASSLMETSQHIEQLQVLFKTFAIPADTISILEVKTKTLLESSGSVNIREASNCYDEFCRFVIHLKDVDWPVVKAMSSCTELFETLSTTLLKENVDVLIDAVEDHNDSWIREDTVSDLIKIQKFTKPNILRIIECSDNSDRRQNELFSLIRCLGDNNLRDNVVSRLGNCQTHLQGLMRLYNGLANRGELTKEIICSILASGRADFLAVKVTDEPSVNVSYSNKKGKTSVFSFVEIQELRSRALLISNADRPTEVQMKINVAMNEFVSLVDKIQVVLAIGHELREYLANFPELFKMSIPCSTSPDQSQSLLETETSQLKVNLSAAKDAFHAARTSKSFLNYFSSSQIWRLYDFFASESISRGNQLSQVHEILRTSDRDVDLSVVTHAPRLPDRTPQTSLFESLETLGNLLEYILGNTPIRLRKVVTSKAIEANVHDISYSDAVSIAIIPSERQLIHVVLSYYLNDNAFPEPSQLLICDQWTTFSEVELLVLRCFSKVSQRANEPCLHCIAGIEHLNASIQERMFSLIEILSEPTLKFKLLLVFQEGKMQQHILDLCQKFTIHTTHGLSETTLMNLIRSQFPESITVASAAAGIGKSEYISRRAMMREVPKRLRTVHVGGPVTRRELVHSLSQLQFRSYDCLHLDIFPVQHSFDVNVLLFELVVLRCAKTGSYQFLLSMDAPIFVELANTFNNEMHLQLPFSRALEPVQLVFNFDDFLVSPDIDSPVQVVCNYLRAREQHQLEEFDIDFHSTSNAHSIQMTSIPDQDCKELLRRSIVNLLDDSAMSFNVINIFLNVLAQQLRDFSQSSFFRIETLKQTIKTYQQVRVNLFETLQSVALEFATRSIGFSKQAQRSNLVDSVQTIPEMKSFTQCKHWIVAFQTQSRGSISAIYRDPTDVPESVRKFYLAQTAGSKKELDRLNQLTSKQLVDRLETLICRSSNPDRKYPIYAMTVDNFLKMSLMILRIRANVAVVIMGETGCGKTSLIKFLSITADADLRILNVHAGTSLQSIKEIFQEVALWLSLDTSRTSWIFLDEINTSDHLCFISNIICHRMIDGYRIHDGIALLAACNPYRVRKENSSLVTAGLASPKGKDNMSKLVYRVHALPEALLDFVWDFGSLQANEEEFYIQSMVGSRGHSKLGALCLFHSQAFIRKHDEDSSVSLRDVSRCILLFDWFLQNLALMKASFILYDKEKEKTLRAWVLALSHCYHSRLPTASLRGQYRAEVAGLFATELKQRVTEEMIHNVLLAEQDAYLSNMELPEGTAKNLALSENVFVLVVCILNRIPVFLVGKPGCSKSLAMQLIRSNMRGPDSKFPLFKKHKEIYVIAFQGSESSTSDGIIAVFEKAKNYQQQNKDIISVVLLDEIGLAEISSHNPLKVLHSLMEPPEVSIVGISNWTLDAAKMNRVIHLSRPEPDENDLVRTAEAIQTGNPAWRHFPSDRLKPIARAYHKYYPSQLISNFHGLRDYYSLIKALLRTSQSNSYCKDVLVQTIRRNFGGLSQPIQTIQDLFLREFHFDHDDHNDLSQNVLDTIYENLADLLARHLMIISRGDMGLSLLETHLRSKNIKPVIIYGSRFKADDSEEYRYRMLNRIILCMEAGKTLVLKDLNSIYGSLYDMLNQNYSIVGGKKNCRVALGAHSNPMCFVHDEFRCIVLIEEAKVKEEDPPFLNRFEKQRLNYEHMLDARKRGIIVQLETWVTNFSNVIARDSQVTFDEYSTFAGFSSSTIESLVILVDKISDPVEAILRICQHKLLNIAFSDSIIRLKRSKLFQEDPSQISSLESAFFDSKIHSDLTTLVNTLSHDEEERGHCVIAFTFDGICDNLDGASFLSEVVQFEKLSSFSSEKSLTDRIQVFWSQDSSATLLILQCHVIVDSAFIAMTKFTIDRIRDEYYFNGSVSKKHVIMVLHLNREYHALKQERAEWQFDFLCGWNMVTIDTVKPRFSSIAELKSLSVLDIVSKEGSPLSFSNLLEAVLGWCFTTIKYPMTTGAVTHIRALRERIITCPDIIAYFEGIVLLELKSLPETDWQVEIACDRRLLRLNSTYFGALLDHIHDNIRQPLSKLIYLLEGQNCLESLFISIENHDEELIQLWFSQVSSVQVNISSIRQVVSSPECFSFEKHALIEFELPFVFDFIQQVERLRPEYQNFLQLQQDNRQIGEAARTFLQDSIEAFPYSDLFETRSKQYFRDFLRLTFADSHFEYLDFLQPLLIAHSNNRSVSTIADIHVTWWTYGESMMSQVRLVEICQQLVQVEPLLLEIQEKISHCCSADIGPIILTTLGVKLLRLLIENESVPFIKEWVRQVNILLTHARKANAIDPKMIYCLRICIDFSILLKVDQEAALLTFRHLASCMLENGLEVFSLNVFRLVTEIVSKVNSHEISMFYTDYIQRVLEASSLAGDANPELISQILNQISQPESRILAPGNVLFRVLGLHSDSGIYWNIIENFELADDFIVCLNRWLLDLGSISNEFSVLLCDTLETGSFLEDPDDPFHLFSGALGVLKKMPDKSPIVILCASAYLRAALKRLADILIDGMFDAIPDIVRLLSQPHHRCYALRVFLLKQIRQCGKSIEDVRLLCHDLSEISSLAWLAELPWNNQNRNFDEILGYNPFALDAASSIEVESSKRLTVALERSIAGQGESDLEAYFSASPNHSTISQILFRQFYLRFYLDVALSRGKERTLGILRELLSKLQLPTPTRVMVTGFLSNDFNGFSQLKLSSKDDEIHLKLVLARFATYICTSGMNSLFAHYALNPAQSRKSMVVSGLEDELGSLIRDMSAAGHQFAFYKCQNGHPYLVDACGRPTEELRCNVCQAPIGGLNHQLMASNTPVGIFHSGTQTTAPSPEKLGFWVDSIPSLRRQDATIRNLSPIAFRVLNTFVHMSIVFGIISSNSASLEQHRALFGNQPQTNIMTFCMESIRVNWEMCLGRLSVNSEGLCILFHSIISNLAKSGLSHGELLLDGTQRSQWEKVFQDRCVSPCVSNTTSSIQTLRLKSQNLASMASSSNLELEIDELDGEFITKEIEQERLPRLFRIRTHFEDNIDQLKMNCMSAFFQLDKTEQDRYPLLSLLFQAHDDPVLIQVSQLSSLVEWARLVESKLGRKISRADALRMTMQEFLHRYCQDTDTEVFNRFCDAWNGVKDLVKTYECEELHLLPSMMSLDASLMLSVLEKRDNGIPLYAMLITLAGAQNKMLDSIISMATNGLRAVQFLNIGESVGGVPIQKVLKIQPEHLIKVNDWRVPLPYVRSDPRYGHGMTAIFDFEKLQNDLAVTLINKKVAIDLEIPAKFPFMFEQFLECMTLFEDIRQQIRQEDLLSEITKNLHENRALQPAKTLTTLDVVLYYVRRVHPTTETTIDQFCRQWLSRADYDGLIPDIGSLPLKNIVAVYEAVEELASRRTVDCTPDLYKSPLPDHIADQIRGAVCSDHQRLLHTITALNRYLFRFLFVTFEPGDKTLGAFLGCCWPVPIDEFGDLLPPEVLHKHAFCTRELLLKELSLKNEQAQSKVDSRLSKQLASSTTVTKPKKTVAARKPFISDS